MVIVAFLGLILPNHLFNCGQAARALRRYRTPEEIKRATMHSTNKAFERYFQFESDDLRSIYADTALTPQKTGLEKGNLLKLQG
jgi:hypothetical protein